MGDIIFLSHFAQAHLKEVVYVVQKDVHLSLGHQTRVLLRIYGVLHPEHEEHEHLLELPPLHSPTEFLQKLRNYPSYQQTPFLSLS